MLKLIYDKERDRMVVVQHGSRRRAVAKDQVRKITSIGHLWRDPGQGHDTCSLYPVTRTVLSARAERYIRYRNACDWYGIRY